MAEQSRPEKNVRETSRRVRRLVLLVCAIGLAALIGVLWRAVDSARQAAFHSRCCCQLSTLQLALEIYHDAHGHFPPAYLANKDGKAIHSWRVLVLPHLGERELYDAYRFDEPWDGPNNIRLADKMPEVYRCPNKSESDSMTDYVVIVGEDTAFPFDRSTSSEDFRDGPENTILVAELAASDIIWTEPRDLAAETMSFAVNHESLPSISSARRQGPLVNTAESSASYALSRQLDVETVRALTTIAGGDEISMVKFRDTGFESLGGSAVTDQTLRDFGHWNSVTDLWLSLSKVTDAGLACLRGAPRLHSLNLSGTDVTDAALDHLRGLPDLYFINLRRTQVSPCGVLELVASSDYVRVVFPGGSVFRAENAHQFQLVLNSPAITGEHLAVFGIVRAPAYLHLDGTALTDRGLADLKGFLDLRRLRIANTEVTDVGLEHLAGFASLEDLDLSGLQGVTDNGVKHLERLTAIKWLKLCDTGVTDRSVHSLRQALPNCRITH